MPSSEVTEERPEIWASRWMALLGGDIICAMLLILAAGLLPPSIALCSIAAYYGYFRRRYTFRQK